MKIYVSPEFDRFVNKVAFVSDEGMVRTAFNFVKGTAHTIQPGDALPPGCIMEIPVDIFDEMVKGFAEIANERGLKLESDIKREGRLEAQSEHLKDLRKLLKL